MGTLWQQSGQTAWDNNGERALGAEAYFYESGTTTPKPVYQDGAETTAHEFPVEASGAGRWPAVFIPFGTGLYKLIIKTADGETLFSADAIPNPAPFDESFELDETTVLNTGDIFLSLDNATRTGAVRLNGRSIGNASSSATERANADTEALFTYLWNKLANAQAAVSGGRGANAAADFAAAKRLTLPDFRGTSVVGFDDMGNSAASLLGTAPVVSGGVTTTGSILGANTHALTTGQLASHSHTGTTASNGAHTHTGNTDSGGSHTHTGTTGGQSQDHTHNVTTTAAAGAAQGVTGGGSLAAAYNVGQNLTTGGVSQGHTHDFTTNSDGSHTHSFTTGSNGAHTHTFTSDATGSGTAHNILSRAGTVTYFMKL